MAATEINDTDDLDLYPPIPEDFFDALLEGSKHDEKHVAAARWVLVPLLDAKGRQVLTRDGEWMVLSVNEAAMVLEADPRAVRRVVGDIRRAYAKYRLENDLVEGFGPTTEAQWQANRLLQAETVKRIRDTKPKSKRGYVRRSKNKPSNG